jgi:hypothetical protein
MGQKSPLNGVDPAHVTRLHHTLLSGVWLGAYTKAELLAAITAIMENEAIIATEAVQAIRPAPTPPRPAGRKMAA